MSILQQLNPNDIQEVLTTSLLSEEKEENTEGNKLSCIKFIKETANATSLTLLAPVIAELPTDIQEAMIRNIIKNLEKVHLKMGSPQDEYVKNMYLIAIDDALSQIGIAICRKQQASGFFLRLINPIRFLTNDENKIIFYLKLVKVLANMNIRAKEWLLPKNDKASLNYETSREMTCRK